LKNGIKKIAMWLILLVIFIMVISAISSNMYKKMTYSELLKNLNEDKIETIQISDDNKTASVKIKEDNVEKTVTIPSLDTFMFKISDQLAEGKLELSQMEESKFLKILEAFGPTLLLMVFIFFIWVMFMNPNSQGGNKTMSFGKSKARMMTPADKNKITFEDVAGIEEEKQELEEIVEFLKNPKKFTEMGARIPKGVLLVGHPGTGKTLLAKAVAGEAGVPFFIISGSDFVEMFVGVGASRVRDLFDQAKKNSPCIVFIDEIDAVGRRRGAGLGGGHDEREQTLNQLLVEMDGFGVNEGVIVVAATNRADILDPAILRPGRFDRQVYVGRPDVKGREAILRVHAKGKPLSSEVDLKVVAQTTSGFTGADLANLLNEAALLTARANKKAIDMEEIQKAFVKVGIGTEKKSRVISDKEKFITAYHESGHAILFELLSELDPVHSISIIPTGMAGGYTMPLPGEDRMYMTKLNMEQEIISFLGGRAAEYIVLKDVTTGASNDIQRATAMARSMVTQYGMSDILGPIQFGDDSNEVFIGRDWGHARNYSEDIATTIVDTAYSEAIRMLKENMEILHASAKLLVEKEKITGEEFRELFDEEKRSKVLGVTTISENNEESKEENEKGVSLEKEQQKEVDLEKKEE